MSKRSDILDMTKGCDFQPYGELRCGKKITWIGVTDDGSVLALSCDHHSDVLAGDQLAGTADCSWFRLLEPK